MKGEDSDAVKSSFTVLFEDPFWIGIYERFYEGKHEAAKIVFGAEPSDSEVFEFLLNKHKTLRFSPPGKIEKMEEKTSNPKRVKREIRNRLKERGVGTKAQQAVKLLTEQNKQERNARKQLRKEKAADLRFRLKQEKKKEKRKGR